MYLDVNQNPLQDLSRVVGDAFDGSERALKDRMSTISDLSMSSSHSIALTMIWSPNSGRTIDQSSHDATYRKERLYDKLKYRQERTC